MVYKTDEWNLMSIARIYCVFNENRRKLYVIYRNEWNNYYNN